MLVIASYVGQCGFDYHPHTPRYDVDSPPLHADTLRAEFDSFVAW